MKHIKIVFLSFTVTVAKADVLYFPRTERFGISVQRVAACEAPLRALACTCRRLAVQVVPMKVIVLGSIAQLVMGVAAYVRGTLIVG